MCTWRRRTAVSSFSCCCCGCMCVCMCVCYPLRSFMRGQPDEVDDEEKPLPLPLPHRLRSAALPLCCSREGILVAGWRCASLLNVIPWSDASPPPPTRLPEKHLMLTLLPLSAMNKHLPGLLIKQYHFQHHISWKWPKDPTNINFMVLKCLFIGKMF